LALASTHLVWYTLRTTPKFFIKDIPNAPGQIWYAAGVIGSKLLAVAELFGDILGFLWHTARDPWETVFGVRRGTSRFQE